MPNLLTSGRLNGYLADIDRQATELFFRLVEQMADRESVTEKLKAEQPMEWVGTINALRGAAAEIVNAEVIFAYIEANRKPLNEVCNVFKRKNEG